MFSSMAHFEKFTKAGTWQVLEHDKHTREGKHIDKSKTHLNYNLSDVADPWQYVKDHIAESIKAGNRFNTRSVALVSCVVTLPKDFVGDSKKFFEESKKYLDTIFGAENVVSCWVHVDETQPHMHYKVMPIIKDTKQFNAKKLMTRSFLKSFHPKMERHLSNVFGHRVGVVNGATTQGNQTIQQLKALTEVKDKLIATSNDLQNLLKEKDQTQLQVNLLKGVAVDLINQIEDLRQTVATLEGEDFRPIFGQDLDR